MHADVAALLAVQEDDARIHDLEAQMAELRPRLDALAAERDRAIGEHQQAQRVVESEERRRQEVAARVAQHRTLQEKNEQTLSTVSSMREATAATAQVEQAKRMIDEDERELAAIGQRLVEAARLAEERQRVAGELEDAQAQARASLANDQQALEAQLTEAQRERETKAKRVPRSLLARYERIHSRKRMRAVFALRGDSCGNCDTSIPLQRRSLMVSTGAVEICEGCGVMVYASE